MIKKSKTLFLSFLLLLFIFLPQWLKAGNADSNAGGCGSHPGFFTVGGTLDGLSGTVVLLNNSGDNLTLTSNGSFTFSNGLPDGAGYSVTVLTQPSNQNCTVSNGSGVINGENVTNVTVSCSSDNFTVGGTLSGLGSGKTIVLQDNGGDNLTLSSNGAFTFPTTLTNGSSYLVTILTQPSGQTCVLSNGAGTINSSNVTNVTVNCTVNNYTVGGTLNGLGSGKTIVLQNNGGDNLTLSSNGAFTFPTALPDGSNYSVTILTQPSGQTCMLINASGTIHGANITNVGVSCSLNSYTVGGTLSGLGGGKTVVLQNNGGNNLSLSSNGAFTFPTAILEGSTYSVTVFTQPAGQICTIANASGTINAANVTNVMVTCAATTFTVGGNLSGLGMSKTVVLQNNGGDNLSLSSNGAFTFPAALADGSPYSVTILTQPAAQLCAVMNGNGTISGANVTNVVVNCLNTFTVGGSLSGLGGGKTVVLQNNGGNNLSLSSNGSFTFSTALVNGASYSVTVLTQPTSQTCLVSNGSGTISGANVTNVTVTCATNTYTVGGTLSGLGGGKTVVLQNNGGDNLSLSSNGAFTFPTALPDGSSYSVTILTQPVGQTCNVTNGSGTISSANVTNVTVTCATNTYTVGGTLSGLGGGKTVVLQNNGGDNLSLSSNGAFTFPTALPNGSSYSVTILTQPVNQFCSVTNGSGTISGANVTNVAVSCVNTFTVGGNLSGLGGGKTVVLENNGGNNLSLSSNGSFTFSTAIPNGSSYLVTVFTQPAGQFCFVSNGSGTISGANITNVDVACADGYTVGGTLSGLGAGKTVILQNNFTDDLALSTNGVYTFPTPLLDGEFYFVNVLTQPTGQFCTVNNDSGFISGANVTNVNVVCVNAYTVGGTLSGLGGGKTVVLQNNGGDNLSLSSNGAFTFSTEVGNGFPYSVTVLTQPAGQICTVMNGSGTISGANVTNVVVNCVNSYTVGGTLSGLSGCRTVTLQNNGGNNLTLSADGSFTFSNPIGDGSSYSVTVSTQPIGQSCTVMNGSGTIAGANVTNVSVNCVAASYTVSGTVSGLGGGNTVVLQNNGGDNLSISANGGFTFTTPVTNGSTYSASVLTQPVGQTCTIANPSGTISSANVTNITVTCAATTFTVGGTLSGLGGGKTVVLQNNGGDNLSRSSNGLFTFPTAIANGSAYSVTVFTQPVGQVCTVINASGTISGANVTNVTVSCSTVLVVGTLGGFSISTNGGTSFINKTTADGLGSNVVFDALVNDSGIFYAATVGGLSISTNGGTSFVNRTTANGMGSNNSRGAFVSSGGTIYVATAGGLAISCDTGGTLFSNKTTANGLGSNDQQGVFVTSGGTIYVATANGLSISSDGGSSFSNKTTANGLGSNVIHSVFISSGGTIYAGTSGGLSISSDGGNTFSNKTTANGLGNNNVNEVFVTSGGTIYAATNNGLGISNDGGTTFVNKTTANGLGDNGINGVFVSNSGTIYASTANGLSISSDGGTSFINRSTPAGLGSNTATAAFFYQ